jgi:hypothetical protein
MFGSPWLLFGCRLIERLIVIASEAKQSSPAAQRKAGLLRRFAPLHKRFAFVAGNDG